ncbi:FkbM family methyltransferase [Bradyrhizobium sp. B117]|uniref:FkbM family methyltransferase n=1 Tax=Bradyrhizobium sp. B117 TaxID=3140246 RepID=UPI003183F499
MRSRLHENLLDLMAFGPRFLGRHVPRITGADTASVSLESFGRLHMRAGESDVAAVRQVFRDKGYDIGFNWPTGRAILNRYNEILGSGKIPVIVDAGANIGAATVFFSSQFPNAHVVAVEPEPGNFAVLLKNVEKNKNITALRAAIGSTEGFVSVKNDGLGWAARTERAASGVPVVTMRGAFGSVPNGIPFIAKIDIEGFEADLFANNVEWLDDTYVVYIEPHDWMLPGQRTSRTFQREMAKRDFEILIRGENLTYVKCALSVT